MSEAVMACERADAGHAAESAAHSRALAYDEARAAVDARAVHHVDGGKVAEGVELLIEEVPVALVFNGVSHAVMLATPNDLVDFAYGFALSEGIVQTPHEIRDVEVHERAVGIEVAIEIASERFAALKERRRSLAGRTGCGLCGVESLASFETRCTPVAAKPRVHAGAIVRALDAMRAHQRLHALTSGAHAACWADLDGNIVSAREDVGRHNALDKLLGALARAGADTSQGFVGISSRASYEMIHKAARRGIGVVAALAAPTAHAARSAAELGMTLAAKARGRRFVVVAGADGIATE